jgi:hypothetical protein
MIRCQAGFDGNCAYLCSKIIRMSKIIDKRIETEGKIKAIKRLGAERLYEDERFIVVHPKTEAASCLYGKGTQWCTSARHNNKFNHYHSRGKLYVIVDKKTHAKYQFHFETRSYRDELNVPLTKDAPLFGHLTAGIRAFFISLADGFLVHGLTFYDEMDAFYKLWANSVELAAFYEKCMWLAPDNQVEYVLAMEIHYFHRNESRAAVEWYEKYLHLKSPRIFINLGDHYHLLGLGLEAMDNYKRGLDVAMKMEEKMLCYKGMGNVLFMRGEYAEAMRCYVKGRKFFPNVCLDEEIGRCGGVKS